MDHQPSPAVTLMTVQLSAVLSATDETLADTIRRAQGAGFTVQSVGRWCESDLRWRLEITRTAVIP